MKQIKSLLLCISLLLGMCSCGTSTVLENISIGQAKTDAQEYLNAFISENAKILSFVQKSSNNSEHGLELNYLVEYMDNEELAQVNFMMVYQNDGSQWNLVECRMETNDNTEKTEQEEPVANTPEAGNKTSNFEWQLATSFAEESYADDYSSAMSENSKTVNGVSSIDDIREIYKFKLDGKSYALPSPLQDFLDSGWELTGYPGTQETLSPKSANTFLRIRKDDASVSVTLANFTEAEIPATQGVVIGIAVTMVPGAVESVAFETALGLKQGDSLAQAIELYGDELYKEDEFTLEYQYQHQLELTDSNTQTLKVGDKTISSTDDFLKITFSEWKVTGISMQFWYE